MGVAITDIVPTKEIKLEDLSGKVLAVDAMNQLYMFLSSIRGPDGTLLQDSKGNVTSHLSGLFFRFSRLMQSDIKLVFVFDGKAPELKRKEQLRRAEVKLKAEKEFQEAKAREDLEAMKKFAQRTSKLTPEMKTEAMRLIAAMGIPIVQAPSEGEAQAAYLVKKGQAYAVMSQDTDSLLFGATRVVKNLSITRRKKEKSKLAWGDISPELIILYDVLKELELSQEQLIALSMLVGTDYNVGGIKGIGPKNALKLVKEYKSDLPGLFAKVKWSDHFSNQWDEVFYLFKNVETTDDYVLHWNAPDKDAIVRMLVEEHDFSEDRVLSSLQGSKKEKKDAQQKGLGEFF
jgi:flap endonuclease-1